MLSRSENIDSSEGRGSGEAAYDAVFRRYFPALCFFAQRLLPAGLDAADVVMDCFTRIWEKRAQIDDPENLGPFLYTSVRNACFDLLRKKKLPMVRLDEIPLCEPSDDSFDALQSLIQAETLRSLYEHAEQLPPKLKTVFKKFFIEGDTEQGISKALDRSYHTIRGQRLRAVEILQEKTGIKTDKR